MASARSRGQPSGSALVLTVQHPAVLNQGSRREGGAAQTTGRGTQRVH